MHRITKAIAAAVVGMALAGCGAATGDTGDTADTAEPVADSRPDECGSQV